MQLQEILKRKDLRDSQKRITLFLKCGHIISLTARQMQLNPRWADNALAATRWPCGFCADPEYSGENTEPDARPAHYRFMDQGGEK